MNGQASRVTIHGSCVAFIGSAWPSPIAILLRGPSGAGKSDLALRLIDGGAQLVADDQTCLSIGANGELQAAAPRALAGLLEVRGVGILRLPYRASAPVGLAIDLIARDAVIRLPDRAPCPMLRTTYGVEVPRFCLHAFDAATPARLRLAVALVCGSIEMAE